MSFGTIYSEAYDALYREKDYEAEARFVSSQFRKAIQTPNPRVLDLGCGTGIHDIALAKTGISITGVDRSPEMLAIAQRRRSLLTKDIQAWVEFELGDIRTIQLDRKYDVIVSLFHVMSYMTEDEDLDGVLATVRRHITPGGIFVFDFWHGPTVIRHPPVAREKTIEGGGKRIRRTSTSDWDRDRHLVRIDYQIEIIDLATGKVTHDGEQHLLRYLFPDELTKRLNKFGFDTMHFGEWLTDALPSDETFSVFAVARRQ